MKPYVFHPAAKKELDEAVAYYERCRKGLGLEFLAEVERRIAVVQGEPERFAVFQDTGCRKCLVHRFPYNLYYRDLAENVRIIAVAHQKRKPGYWKKRTRG